MEEGIPETVCKEIVMDMTDTYYPTKPVIPFIKVTQDRVVLESREAASAAAVSVRPVSYTVPSGNEMWRH